MKSIRGVKILNGQLSREPRSMMMTVLFRIGWVTILDTERVQNDEGGIEG